MSLIQRARQRGKSRFIAGHAELWLHTADVLGNGLQASGVLAMQPESLQFSVHGLSAQLQITRACDRAHHDRAFYRDAERTHVRTKKKTKESAS